MTQTLTYLRKEKGGTVSLLIYVQPKASRNKVVGLHDDAVKISTTAPPVEGKANAAVIKILSKFFNLPKSAIALQAGRESRKKRFSLSGISLADAQEAIARHLTDS